MTDAQGFELHPGEAQDIAEIRQFIAEDNPLAATRFREDILEAIHKLVKFPVRVTSGPISLHDRCDFRHSTST